jgi:hypothetical protein
MRNSSVAQSILHGPLFKVWSTKMAASDAERPGAREDEFVDGGATIAAVASAVRGTALAGGSFDSCSLSAQSLVSRLTESTGTTSVRRLNRGANAP